MKWLKQLCFDGGHELIPERRISPFVNTKLPIELKANLMKIAKDRECSQKEILIEALKNNLKEII